MHRVCGSCLADDAEPLSPMMMALLALFFVVSLPNTTTTPPQPQAGLPYQLRLVLLVVVVVAPLMPGLRTASLWLCIARLAPHRRFTSFMEAPFSHALPPTPPLHTHSTQTNAALRQGKNKASSMWLGGGVGGALVTNGGAQAGGAGNGGREGGQEQSTEQARQTLLATIEEKMRTEGKREDVRMQGRVEGGWLLPW